MILPRKHQGADLTIFTEMSALAKEYDAINLSQGFPDYPIDGKIKEFLAEATQKDYNQYAPMAGLLFLIHEVINFNSKRAIPIVLNADEVTITPGATYGIYCALASILNPGDEVIVLEPSYDSYVPSIEVNGGIAVFVSLDANYRPDFETIQKAITPKTKAIIVNSPHNPCGTVWTAQEWEQLWELIKDKQIIVIADEVYDQLCYHDTEFTSVFHHEGLRERSFAIFSFGKMFHLTGWKVGYVLAPEAITKAFRHVHQFLCFSVNTPAQWALAKYLEHFDRDANLAMMQQKRDFFLQQFNDLPFEFAEPSQGSYFQVAKFNNSMQQTDKEFTIWLTREKGVAVIPMSAFYHNQLDTGSVRFCFAKKEDTILKAAERLRNNLIV